MRPTTSYAQRRRVKWYINRRVWQLITVFAGASLVSYILNSLEKHKRANCKLSSNQILTVVWHRLIYSDSYDI